MYPSSIAQTSIFSSVHLVAWSQFSIIVVMTLSFGIAFLKYVAVREENKERELIKTERIDEVKIEIAAISALESIIEGERSKYEKSSKELDITVDTALNYRNAIVMITWVCARCDTTHKEDIEYIVVASRLLEQIKQKLLDDIAEIYEEVGFETRIQNH